MATHFFGKAWSILLLVAVLSASIILAFESILLVYARPNIGEYIVTEWGKGNLCKISTSGVRTVIYQFPRLTTPSELEIDSSGNYIIAEYRAEVLSKISPTGVRTVIYRFEDDSGPDGLAIDSQGNYIVTESEAHKLSKITPNGVRTEIYSFSYGYYPAGVVIDSQGNYIVALSDVDILAKVTPEGAISTIYNFNTGSWPDGVAIDAEGNYIVTEYDGKKIDKITPAGVKTVIYSYGGLDAGPDGVTIDADGNYIVAEFKSSKLSKITPTGIRTPLYTFADGTEPEDVAVVTQISPILSAFDLHYAASYVRMIYPSEATVKPLGCSAAMISDWLSSMAVASKLQNFTEGLDINSNFVDQTIGTAIGNPPDSIVSFGGPIVNPVVKYAESETTPQADRAPLRYHYADSICYFQHWNGSTITGANLPISNINNDKDMFVIETYQDASGRYMMLCYGFGWKGTYAAGKFFDSNIYHNLDSYKVGWIIVKWEDTNGDGFVNYPNDGDTYTVAATAS
jgi:sugar lactone lactonase YvrE